MSRRINQLDQFDDVKPGSWVRFMYSGRPVIGQVEYLCRTVGGSIELCTDAGIVNIDSVLEVRNDPD